MGGNMKIIAAVALAIVAVLVSSTPPFAQQGSVTISEFPIYGHADLDHRSVTMYRWLSVAALALLAPTIQAQEPQPVVLSDYPRYATTPPPQHIETLHRIGRALAGAAAQADGSNMLQVSVVGHADF